MRFSTGGLSPRSLVPAEVSPFSAGGEVESVPYVREETWFQVRVLLLTNFTSSLIIKLSDISISSSVKKASHQVCVTRDSRDHATETMKCYEVVLCLCRGHLTTTSELGTVSARNRNSPVHKSHPRLTSTCPSCHAAAMGQGREAPL